MQETQSWKLVYFYGPWEEKLTCLIGMSDEAAVTAHWFFFFCS